MKYVWLLLAASCCFAQSIQSLSAQIQRTPTAALYIDRGAAYAQAGDYKQAVADYDRALQRDSVNTRALRLRATAQAKMGRTADAITDYSSAISLSPASAALYLERATAYLAAGDPQHALADRDEAVRLAPLSVDALLARGASYQQLGKVQDAEADRNKAIELAPNRADAWTARASGYYAQGQVQKAQEDASTALKADSTNTEARALLAKINGEPEPAGPAAVPLSPKAPPATSPKTLESAKAVAPVKPAASADRTTASESYQRGRDLVNAGKAAEGILAYDKAIQLQPGMALAWNARGFAYYMTKDYPKAIRDLSEAIRLDPNYLNAIHNRSLARRASGDTAGSDSDHARELQITQQLKSKQ
ncbi:MAG: tetratricopeptide repeat protein [Acidobacteriota bacterium]